MVDIRTPACSWAVMNSWCSPIAGQVTCRSRASASCGNQPRTSSAHSCSLFGGPPGAMPAASAGAMYFRSVLRSTPKLAAIWFFDRPACQCIKISVTSITSNVLLAIGPRPRTGREGRLLLLDGQVHPDTHAIPMGNHVIRVGNYVSADSRDVSTAMGITQAGIRSERTPEMRKLIVSTFLTLDGVMQAPGRAGRGR